MSNLLAGVWGRWTFDEAQGTRHDGSVNGNDLAEADENGNAPAPIYAEEGLINKAASWTLNQRRFQLRNVTATMDGSGGMTIAFWARLDCVTNPNKTDTVSLALYVGDFVNYVPPYINLNIYANGNGTYPIPCLALEIWGETVDDDFYYYLSSWDWDEPTSDITKGEWHLYVLRIGSTGLILTVDKKLYCHEPNIKTLPGNMGAIRFQGHFVNLPQQQTYSLDLGPHDVSLEVNGAPWLASEVTWGHVEGVKYETAFFHEIGGIPTLFHIAITEDGTKVYSNYSLIIHNTGLTYPYNPAAPVNISGTFLNYSDRMQSYELKLDEAAAWERAITDEEEAALYNDGAGLPFSQWGGDGQYGLAVGPAGFRYAFGPAVMSVIPPTPPPTHFGGPVNPHVALQVSRDGGHTWSDEMVRAVGRIGETRKRMIWNRLGRARNAAFRISVTGPVKAVLCDALVDVDEGTN